MRLPGPTETFVLFDDARTRAPAPARLYRDPVSVIAAHRLAEVQPALDRLAEAAEAGLPAAGFIAYEAGLALEDRLHPLAERHRQDRPQTPLLCFGPFAGVRLLEPGPLTRPLPDPAGARG